MKINVIGLGYIGLPTAATFAQAGVDVLGVDITPSVVDTINQGKIHIEEPGLAEVIADVVSNGKFKASLTPEPADVHIIAVPTPNKNDEYLSCELKHVISAVNMIIPVLQKGDKIIVESTIAPRSTEDFVLPLIKEAGFTVGEDIYLAHCPERVLPGKILYEMIHNNRIVGGITDACTEQVAEVYAQVVKGEIVKTAAKTAEMSKLMENTFRDVNIALANELAKVCTALDINVLDVIDMANKHPRVNIHTPGPGVGGHCLAVDPYFIYAKAPELANIIKLSRDTNCSMPSYVVESVDKLTKGDKTKTISVMGVTYKPDVDDRRESPSMVIIDLLEAAGYKVVICDPHVEDDAYLTIEEAVSQGDLILNLVGHQEFIKAFANYNGDKTLFDVSGSIKSENIVNYGNLYKFI